MSQSASTETIPSEGETPGFRSDVRAFLDANLPTGWRGVGGLAPVERQEFVTDWRRRCAEERLLAVTWDEAWGGRGLGKLDHLTVVQEFAKAGVPLGISSDTGSIKLLGNTLARWGTDEQRLRFLPRIISGEDVWCQGYSEPGSGSDLASLRTKAVLDGDQWRINGQKIWTSNATSANWMFLLARTDPDARASRSISMLLVPMDQPGIDVRPIRMTTGQSGFSEVFLDDARTDVDLVVGSVNDGWRVANSLLSQERGEEAAINPVLFAEELDRLLELARSRPSLSHDLRRRLATAYVRLRAMRAMGAEILADYVRDGSLGPAASVSKLYWSQYHQDLTELAVDLYGVDALELHGEAPLKWYRTNFPGTPNDTASWVGLYLLNGKAGTIYAGTSEIQRNIIGERALGLPRDPR